MWDLDHKEGWVLKNSCFQTVVLTKTLENPLNSKIKPVNLKGNQHWIFIGRTDAGAPILWPPMQKAISLEKTLMLGKTEGKRRWQRMRRLDGITDSMDMSLINSGSWWCTGKPCVLQSMRSQRVKRDWMTELKLNWTVLEFVGTIFFVFNF